MFFKLNFETKMNKTIQYLFFIFTFIAFQLKAQTTTNFGNNSEGSDLAALSLISVTIGGNFIVEGTFPASNTERVDQFVTRIVSEYKNGVNRVAKDELSLVKINEKVDSYSKRNILLKRFDGTELKVDLQKFRVTGNYKYNPYLKNGDVIIFPVLDLERNFIDISGAVNYPVKFPFVEGDKLSDAILLAQGINPAYSNVDTAQISRLSYDGNKEEILNIKISDDPLLQRGDRIRILSDENNKRDFSVLVLGEVKRPGKIHITKNNSTLKEVLKKAGGFTKEASLKFSEVIRNLNTFYTLQKKALEAKNNGVKLNLQDQQKYLNIKGRETLKMYRSADITLEDTLFFSIDNSLRSLEGYSQLDLSNLTDPNSYESNFILKDKDVIIIPEKKKDIYIWGGVAKIGNYKYEKGKSVKDYIEQAGGLTEIASGEGEIYLIKGKSREWINIDMDNKDLIEAGDFIYVKKDPPKSFDFYLKRIGSIASIIGTVVTTILLINQFSTKKN